MYRLVAIFGFALAMSACSPASQEATITTTTSVATTTTRAPSNEICIAGDLPFGDDGLIAALGEDTGDAASLADIRWDPSTTCERITVTFGAVSGAPAATLGPTGVSVIPYAGVVRIALPLEVEVSAIADSLLEGDLVRTVYVFRRNGQLMIDIHGLDDVPIVARAFTTASPASLVVDVARAPTDAAPVGVTASHAVVVVAPTPGSGTYPIPVEGYVAPGGASVHVQLIADGATLTDQTIALGGDADAWQSFETAIDDGPIGSVVVFVGSVDDEGQPDSGAMVSVTVE
jgi:hypothetical protein